jgi:DNA helicase-2/ATP-dependent DNA helicase PcrA
MLTVNYRSKSEIIDVANKLIQNNENRHEKVIECSQGSGASVGYIFPENTEEEAVFIAKDILEEVKKDYVEYSDFAVIYRTNIQSRALVDVFMDMRIPFSVKDSIITIYDHWAAQDILAYLRIGLNPKSNKDWVRIINKPFRYISKENVNLVKDEEDFLTALINKCNLHPKQVKTINDLEIDLSYIKTLNPKNAISYIRSSLEYDRYILDYCTNRKIKTNGLIEILNEIESSATNFETIAQYLEHIQKVKEEISENRNNGDADGVVFTTMHSAKGLEFRNVYIIGVNEGTIPHEKSYDVEDDSQIEEERRLMYVAITRAEEKLCISSLKNKYGKKVLKSRFIDDLKAPTKDEIEKFSVGNKIYHKKFKEGIITHRENNSVKIKFNDRERNLDLKACLLNDLIYKIK